MGFSSLLFFLLRFEDLNLPEPARDGLCAHRKRNDARKVGAKLRFPNPVTRTNHKRTVNDRPFVVRTEFLI